MGNKNSLQCSMNCFQGGDEDGLCSIAIKQSPTKYGGASNNNRNRKAELERVMGCDDNEDREGRAWYIIEAKWVKDWLEYVHQDSPPPGPVDNKKLLEYTAGSGWRPRQNLLPGSRKQLGDFRRINAEVWKAYRELYPGSGPAILTYEKPYEDVDNWEVDQSFFPNEQRITLAQAGVVTKKDTLPGLDLNEELERQRQSELQHRGPELSSASGGVELEEAEGQYHIPVSMM